MFFCAFRHLMVTLTAGLFGLLFRKKTVIPEERYVYMTLSIPDYSSDVL